MMRTLLGAIILAGIFLFTSCDTVESGNGTVSAISASKIEKIVIDGKQVTATVVYSTPTPCWNYHHTEKVKSGDNYVIKAFGKDTDEPCILVIDSVTVEEKITFTSSGEKTLKFWQWNEEFIDTVITIQ